MRPGLVAIGLALVAVGALVGYTGFSIQGTSQSTGFIRAISAPNIAPHQDRVLVVSVVNSSVGSFALSWSATAALNVSLFQGVPCNSVSRYCSSGPALAAWPGLATGNWSRSGAIVTPYLLSMENLGKANATLVGSMAESYPDGTRPPPTTTVLTVLAGAILLVAIGGMALFLGLFLRGGVYTEPESVSPRYAHELDRPEGAVDPLDEPFEEDLESDEEPPGPRGAH